MTITITLPPATEDRLRAEAAATGEDVGTLVVKAVQTHLSLADLSVREILAPIHEGFRKSGKTEEEVDAYLRQSLEEVRAERRSGSAPSA